MAHQIIDVFVVRSGDEGVVDLRDRDTFKSLFRLLVGNHLHLVKGFVDTFAGARHCDFVGDVVDPGDGDFGGGGFLQLFQTSSWRENLMKNEISEPLQVCVNANARWLLDSVGIAHSQTSVPFKTPLKGISALKSVN